MSLADDIVKPIAVLLPFRCCIRDPMKYILTALIAFAALFALGASPSNANSSIEFVGFDKSDLMQMYEHFGAPQNDNFVHNHCICSADAFMEKPVPNSIPSNELNISGYGFAPDLFHGIQVNPILAPPRLYA